MALSLEWRGRIRRWMEELPRHIYRRLGDVKLEYFVTREQLTPDQALGREFRSCPPGTKWGAKWEYGWFRGQVTLPKEADGQRIYLKPGIGRESLVWIDGQEAGSVNEPPGGWMWMLTGPRPWITLARKGKGGQTIDLLVETYAGHGPYSCEPGPVPYGQPVWPEAPATQVETMQGEFGVVVEEIYQLHLDVITLFHLRESIDPESLRVADIDEALRAFSRIVDFELPYDEFLRTVCEARKALQPVLAKKNGPTVPELYGFGHGHMDVAWLWPLAETERKEARTLANQLALAEEYPGYAFLNSQTHLFWMVQQKYPKLYERVKKGVKRGQIIADGAWWVEADTNIAGGEALIRQAIYGKRYFREEFGMDSRVLWLPDVFGYTGALPQILKGCRIDYFATAKIFWAYHGGEPFPYNTFWWEGIDGTRILVHLMNDYNSQMRPNFLIERWKQRVQKDGLRSRLFPFGWGDGGGGPDRDHLEIARRCEDLEGCPKLKLSSPEAFFRDIESAGGIENVYVGELYFQAHRGTYTTQAKTKKGNRRSELALREAEMWILAASALAGREIPWDSLRRHWQDVLLHQFHDILPGSSIQRVYEEAEAVHERIHREAGELTAQAAAALTDGRDGAITLLNSLSWDRRALVELPSTWAGAVDAAGEALCVQEVDGRRYAEASIPSCGWTSLRKADKPRAQGGCCGCGGVEATANRLENGLIRVTFDSSGEITSLFDKQAEREFLAGPSNQFRMFKDVPNTCDAWDIDSTYEQLPVAMEDPGRVEVVCSGPLLGRLRVTRKLHQSQMTQEITLRRGSRRVDFQTTVDWREDHKLLKVAFDSNVHANEAMHEIQFGHILRPTHRSRQYDFDRFEVSNHRWTALAEQRRGLAVLNDCKYGINVMGGCVQLTLLKAAMGPDCTADRGRQEFTYSVFVWDGDFGGSGLVREGYELNVPVTVAPGSAADKSLFGVEADNVIIDTVKPAEDGSGDVVVRMYECLRAATRCVLHTSLPVRRAVQTDMLENETGKLDIRDGRVELDFRPFEIKTIRLSLAKA